MPTIPEKSPAKKIADQALANINFQEGMFDCGMADRDVQGQINFLKREAGKFLTFKQLETLEAFEPYGYLTSIARLTKTPTFEHLTDSSVMNRIRFLRNKLKIHLPNSPVTRRFEENKKHPIFGLGCSTENNPTGIAIAFLIYTNEGASLDWIAKQIYPDDDTPSETTFGAVRVGITRLRATLRSPAELVTDPAHHTGGYAAFYWLNAFGR